jgi:hypothetical protein
VFEMDIDNDSNELKNNVKNYIEKKKNIDLEQLKKDAKITYENVEKTIIDFEKDLSNLQSTSLPDGFVLKIAMDNMASLHDDDDKTIRIMIRDKNRKDGESKPKYFWTMDHTEIELSFNDNEIKKYTANTLSGGSNSHEYGNSKNPEIDLITTSEIMMEVNGTYLNLMKLAKENPAIFNKNIDLHVDAKKKHSDLRSIINTEQNRLDEVKRNAEITSIENVFKPLDAEQVMVLGTKLKTSDKYEEKISIVTMDTPKQSYNKGVSFTSIDIRCRNENKKSFSIRTGDDDEYKRIKASDIDKILSGGITVNGNYIQDVHDLANQINRLVLDNLIEDNRRNHIGSKMSLSVPIKMIAEISDDLILEAPEHSKVKVIKKPKR